MSLTKMNVIDIMSEACKSEANTDKEIIDDIADDIKDTVEKCSEMTVPFNYTPEMIPVIFDESTQSYFVEYDMLRKLIESDCDDEEIEVVTKYGTIEFKPKKSEKCKEEDDEEEEQGKVEDDDDLDPITEEEPEDDEDDEEKLDEAYFGNGPFSSTVCGYGVCREKDALNKVILANMPKDPNRDDEECCRMPEMTLENTYIVIESEEELDSYLYEVCEACKSGGKALKQGKTKLKKADALLKNLKNNGLKVAKKPGKKSKGKSKKK